MNEFIFADLLQAGKLAILDYYVSDDKWINFPDKMLFFETWASETEKLLFVCQRVGNVACTHVFIYTYLNNKLGGDILESKKAFKSVLVNFLDRRY